MALSDVAYNNIVSNISHVQIAALSRVLSSLTSLEPGFTIFHLLHTRRFSPCHEAANVDISCDVTIPLDGGYTCMVCL